MHERRPVATLADLVREVAAGSLTMGSESLSWKREGYPEPGLSLCLRVLDSRAARGWLGFEGPVIFPYAIDSMPMRLPEFDERTADASVQALAIPWERLADIRQHFIGTGTEPNRNYD